MKKLKIVEQAGRKPAGGRLRAGTGRSSGEGSTMGGNRCQEGTEGMRPAVLGVHSPDLQFDLLPLYIHSADLEVDS